jgi:hypothetical protein
MRSIPAAMTWEILYRARWAILAATLGAIAFPTMILGALEYDGALNPADRSMMIMNIVVVLIFILAFASALHVPLSQMSRLYAHPARTSTLVAWRLIPAMVLIAIQMAVATAAINLLFGLDWPLAGPVLFAPVALAVVAAAVWLTERSPGWLIISMTITSAALGLWLNSRYGAVFTAPPHRWDHVSTADVITMFVALAVAYWVSVKAVARNRRGEPPLSLGLVDWLMRVFESPAEDMRLTTPLRAQCHVEWHRKGWVMPAAAAFLIFGGLIAWVLGSRSAEELLIGFLLGGYALLMIGFIGGLLLGNLGPNDASHAMGHFLATRPLSNADIARALLRTAAKSVFLAWAIWAAGLLMVWLGLWIAGWNPRAVMAGEQLHWAAIPGILVGAWIISATLLALVSAGRASVLICVGIFLPLMLIALSLLSKFFLTREAAQFLRQAVAVLIASSLLLGTLGAFAIASRRRLIQIHSMSAAATIWLAATLLVAMFVDRIVPNESMQRLLAFLFIAAAAALVVAPVATVPLAVSWNRHR